MYYYDKTHRRDAPIYLIHPRSTLNVIPHPPMNDRLISSLIIAAAIVVAGILIRDGVTYETRERARYADDCNKSLNGDPALFEACMTWHGYWPFK